MERESSPTLAVSPHLLPTDGCFADGCSFVAFKADVFSLFFSPLFSSFSFFILQLQQSTNLSLLKLYVKPTEGGGDELRARREATVAAKLTVATANATYLSWFSFDMVPSI